MKELAGSVPTIVALLLDVFPEQALGCVPMIAAATPVLFFWHSGNESLRLIKGLLNGFLPDQALEELLIEFESA